MIIAARAREQATLPRSQDPGSQRMALRGNPALRRAARFQTAEVDVDGDTDIADRAELLASYGKCPGDEGYNAACNLYENDPPDGCVDLADLALLLADYGCTN